MGVFDDFRKGRDQVRAARGETGVARAEAALEASLTEDERLQREIEGLQRFCRAHGERYAGCPLDMIEAERVVGNTITGAFRITRWLFGQSPKQRGERREALLRAVERAKARQQAWEQDAAQKPLRVRLAGVENHQPRQAGKSRTPRTR